MTYNYKLYKDAVASSLDYSLLRTLWAQASLQSIYLNAIPGWQMQEN
jgi:hypothetical protein